MNSQPDPASREVSALADTLLRNIRKEKRETRSKQQLFWLRSNVSAKADTSRLAGAGCEFMRCFLLNEDTARPVTYEVDRSKGM